MKNHILDDFWFDVSTELGGETKGNGKHSESLRY